MLNLNSHHLMKPIIPLLLTMLLLPVCLFAQRVYSTNYRTEADVKVYVTQYRTEADLIVYKCKSNIGARPKATKACGISLNTAPRPKRKSISPNIAPKPI